MDNAALPWELPCSMRSAVIALLVGGLLLLFLAWSGIAAASDAGEAVKEANEALSGAPPKRDVARAALMRATSADSGGASPRRAKAHPE